MISDYFNSYKVDLLEALDSVDPFSLKAVEKVLFHAYDYGRSILICGNGGSAATAEHFAVDHTKGIRADVDTINPHVICLNSNMSMVTAIANDFDYTQVFSKQIEWFPRNAVVIVISASGNSPNIINALKAARRKDYETIALVGFDGGQVMADQLADYILHVRSNNYGVVEDAHSVIAHTLSQYMRCQYTEKNVHDLKL